MARSNRFFLPGALVVALLSGCSPREKSTPEENASQVRSQAIEAAQAEKWEEAIRLSTEAIKLDPKHPPIWWVRGLAHNKSKQHTRAEADCSQAIKLDPQHAPSYRERGWARINLKQYAKAIEDFDVYVRLRPKEPDGYEGRAVAHSKNGNKQATHEDLLKAEQLRAAKKK